MLVDIHAHLFIEPILSHIDSIITNAKKNGVTHIICAGTDQQSNQRSIGLANKFDIVHAACGLYPDQAGLDKEKIDKQLQWIEDNKDTIIALSECGLDYHHRDDNKEQQKQLFIQQIQLANKLNKPLIIHSRKAEQDVLDILEHHAKGDVILHAFEGNKKLIDRAIKSGYYLTITCNIQRSDQVQYKAQHVPVSQLFTETDAPYMGPEKNRTNEPAHVKLAIEKLAEIKKLDVQECTQMIFMNYKKVFG